MFQPFDERAAALDCRFQSIGKFYLLLAQNDLALTDTRYVEQVIDQADHMIDLPLHHIFDLRDDFFVVGHADDLQAITDGCQRVAQLVRKCGEENVLTLIGQFEGVCIMAQFIALLRDDLALPVKVEENPDLTTQNFGFDGFLQEVDGPAS